MRARLTTDAATDQDVLVAQQAPAPTAPPPTTSGLPGLVEQFISLGGAASLIAGLLYYFGWARSAALYGYFGIDVGTVGLSFQDYVLRSVTSAFWPLVSVGVIGLAAVAVDAVVVRSRRRRMIGRVALGAGCALLLVGIAATVGLISFLTDWPVVPVLMLNGLVLALYGWTLRSRQSGGRRREVNAVPSRARASIGLLLVMLTFWCVSGFAAYRGAQSAEALVSGLDERPAVVVLSAEALDMRGAGVVGPVQRGNGSAYPYCYSGLRLLIESGGRLFLLPTDWQRGRDPVIVLTPADELRFEFFNSTTTPACP